MMDIREMRTYAIEAAKAGDLEPLAKLAEAVHSYEPLALTGLHDLVAISGSLVLGLAVARGRLTPEEGFDLSRIDENWQIEQWGEDEEEAELVSLKRTDYLRAKEIFDLSQRQSDA